MRKVGRSTISTEYIGSFLCRHYGFRIAETVLLHRGFNDTYRVVADGQTVVFRLYQAHWRSENEILAEVGILNFLHSSGVGVTTPIAKKSGGFLTRIGCPEGIRCGVLFELAKGNIPFPFTDSTAKTLGTNLAIIHRELDSMPAKVDRFEIDKRCLVEIPFNTLETTFPGWNKDITELKRQVEQLADGLSALQRTDREYGLIHGDYINVNIHESGGIFTILDWDFCGYGWRAYDLATFLWGLRCGGQESLFGDFLTAYRSERPLSDNSISAIPVLEVFREIWVWGINVAKR
jgi:Ser/Thr protein kinase RdoA (MazF antagonist)